MSESKAIVKANEAVEIGKLIKAGKDSFIKAGKMLAGIKKKLGHCKWLSWLETNKKKLGIGDNPQRAAQRLMMLAENPKLTSDLMWGNKKSQKAAIATMATRRPAIAPPQPIGADAPSDNAGEPPEPSQNHWPESHADNRTSEEKALDWAQEMFRQIQMDLHQETDIDPADGFRELIKILAAELGPDTAPAPAKKRRGRPPGSENKPKPETAEAKPQDQTTGNGVDPEQSAEEMGAKFATMEATAAPAPEATVFPEDGSIPPFMRRAS
jgi:hypothetical protein